MSAFVNPYRFGSAGVSSGFYRDHRDYNTKDADNGVGQVTYNNVAIGSAASDRLVIAVLIARRSTTTPRTLTSCTIGGVTATIHHQIGNTAGGECVAIVSAVVPTGTTATVVTTFSGAFAAGSITTYSITNYVSATPHDHQAHAPATGAGSVNINVPSNGLVIAGSIGFTSTSGDNSSWTGAVEDLDRIDSIGTNSRFTMASQKDLATQTGRTVSVSSSSTRNTLVAATWQMV